jgi:hypothetical protein
VSTVRVVHAMREFGSITLPPSDQKSGRSPGCAPTKIALLLERNDAAAEIPAGNVACPTAVERTLGDDRSRLSDRQNPDIGMA